MASILALRAGRPLAGFALVAACLGSVGAPSLSAQTDVLLRVWAESTLEPIAAAAVEIAGLTATADEEGRVHVPQVAAAETALEDHQGAQQPAHEQAVAALQRTGALPQHAPADGDAGQREEPEERERVRGPVEGEVGVARGHLGDDLARVEVG